MMLRFIIALIIGLAAASAAHAQCATAYPKAALNSQVTTDFPDNTSGQITPLTMRTFQSNLIQSVQQYPGVDTQVGTSYTIALSDYGQLVLFTSNSSVAVSLPAANATGFCPFGFYASQIGTGLVTITPASGTINGGANYTLAGGQSAFIVSDGTNWQTLSFKTGNNIINGGLANQLAYYATNGTTISPLSPTNSSSVLVTNGGGVPSWATTLPSALTIPSPTFSGTATGPDAGTWGSGGINGSVIGATTPENGTFDLLAFTTLSSASLAASPSTVTGLTVNNSPNTSNDYIPYYNAGSGTIERATVGSIGSSGVSGVSSLNGEVGALSLVAGNGMAVNTPTTLTIALATMTPPPQGRLTLQSGTPVMTTTQAAKSTIYYDCYNGGFVPVYNGSIDVPLAITSCEVSTVMENTGTGVINNNGVFDVWAANVTNALVICVATNGSGGGWASDSGSNTSRGTGYSQLDRTTRGYITNKNSIAHCYNGVSDLGSLSANHATYLGTLYSTSAGQTTYQFGAAASTGTAGLFGLWNAYNRVSVASSSIDDGSSYTISGSSWREAHNGTGMQVTAVFGLAEDAFQATFNSATQTITNGSAFAGLGLDSTTAPTGMAAASATTLSGATGGVFNTMSPSISWLPGVGIHVAAALNKSDGVNSNFFNSQASDTFSVSGLRM